MVQQPLRFRLEGQNLNRFTVVRIVADRALLDEANSHAFMEELLGLLDETPRQDVLLDFHNVEYLTSTTLGLLLQLRRRLAASGKSLGLRNLLPHIAEIFVITKLDRLFDIHTAKPVAAAETDPRGIVPGLSAAAGFPE
jgi:anti-sigma B factor antagonist